MSGESKSGRCSSESLWLLWSDLYIIEFVECRGLLNLHWSEILIIGLIIDSRGTWKTSNLLLLNRWSTLSFYFHQFLRQRGKLLFMQPEFSYTTTFGSSSVVSWRCKWKVVLFPRMVAYLVLSQPCNVVEMTHEDYLANFEKPPV